MTIPRTGRPFRVILHRKNRPVAQGDAAIRAVEQGNMRLFDVAWQGCAIDCETMIHGGDFDLAGSEVLDRMVGAVMALMHLDGLGADRNSQHLVAETDAKGRN